MMSEVTAAKTSIDSSKAKLQGQINSAKSSWKGVASSDGLSGSVKTAIDAQINNYQIPLLTNYYDAMHHLSTGFEKAISDFKSTVKESSGAAIIDTEALTTAESKFSDQLSKFTEIESKFKTVYSSISDLVSVGTVSGSGFTEEMEKTKKILTNTKNWMAAFNGKKSSKAISSILSQQQSQINSLKGVAGLSYTNPKSLEIYQNKAFKNGVSKQHASVKEFEKEQLRAKRQAISNIHPSMAVMKGTMSKAELDRIINQINSELGEVGPKQKNTKKLNMREFTSGMIDFETSVFLDSGLDVLEEFGPAASTFVYNVGTKVSGSGVSSAIYAGAKATGAASKVVPILGPAIEYGLQRSSGESKQAAMDKTLINTGVGVVIGAGITAAGLTIGPAIVVGAIAGWAVGLATDKAYDSIRKNQRKNKNDRKK
ncbi:T7SS effector LXG polymorphic toxin [Enterococcus sp. DIV0187]|uniref:T7SS effector LXG polymorphic toxin n=1 Tax=Enterococcus sp. DIV0187 TaxID=2774644 RepID=UPI003F686BA6